MAVYVKSRNEKKVFERLLRENIEAYLPIQETKRRWSDRIKKVQVPLIPSYVFVKTHELERDTILQDPGVMNFVYWLGKPAVIREEEIQKIRLLLNEKGADEEIVFQNFEPGTEVEIQAGTFVGERATVKEDRNKDVTVILKSLGMLLTLSKINLEKN